MAKPFLALCSLLFFVLILVVSPSVPGPRRWWPPHGVIKVKCPYTKVDLSWYRATMDPCPGLKQPICGTNFVTYDNPCILCVESLCGLCNFSASQYPEGCSQSVCILC